MDSNIKFSPASARIAPLAVGRPFSYVTAGNVQYVVYRGRDEHIYELFTRPDGWGFNNLTLIAK